MLGVTAGNRVDGSPSPEENERFASSCRMANRLEHLPLPYKFKSMLAATVVASRAVWGGLLCGRAYAPKESKNFRICFRKAVKCSEAKYDRSSRALQQVLLLGYTSEISLLAAQNCLETLSRWAAGVRQFGQDPTQFNIMGKALKDTLAVWGWLPRGRRWGE